MPTVQPKSAETVAKDSATTDAPKTNGKAEPNKDQAPSSERLGSLRTKFESGQLAADSTKKKKKKNTPKIKYAGAESAKNKFMEEATKNRTVAGPQGPKAFTPPPEGVTVGVLESNPQPRAADVVTADDNEPVDMSAVSEATKSHRAKFKDLEARGGQTDEAKRSELVDEVNAVAPEALRNARAKWKDIESGKLSVDDHTGRQKIDMTGDGYGGVFENDPETLDNITRSGSQVEDIRSGVSAKERREEFMNKASEAASTKKSSKPIDINAAESGIYENEPTRLDGVVRYDDEQADEYPPTSAKWASEAKNRFMQEASKNQERVQRSNTEDETNAPKFATEAKQTFLDRQRELEEEAKNKARPDIIDIWSEQGSHSGVFENKPAARAADVIRGTESDSEDEDDEDEEDEE